MTSVHSVSTGMRTLGTTTFAHFSLRGLRFRSGPAFRASPAHGYVSRSPQIRDASNRSEGFALRHVICPRPDSTSSGSVSWSAAHALGAIGLYVVSVRDLAGLGERMSRNTNPLAFRSSSQASFPGCATSPQLPSPRTSFLQSYIWHTASS